jgi:hypothetical protein
METMSELIHWIIELVIEASEKLTVVLNCSYERQSKYSGN